MDALSFMQLDHLDAGDPLAVAAVVLLSCLLSCDNAVVLALLVRDLPREQHGRALSYGLLGAYVFRVVALVFAVWIMGRWYLKLIGGAYLLYLAIAYFVRGETHGGPRSPRRLFGLGPFWSTVIAVEIADVVFSIDSIAASIAVTQKLWVLILGSAIGMAAMRVAARGFVWLLERFPRLETAAFVAVGAVGLQLLAELPIDVLGRARPGPTTAYATAEQWRAATDEAGPHAFAIPGALVVNLTAPPPPDLATMRAGQQRLLPEGGARAEAAAEHEHQLAHALWNLHYRPFIDLEGWLTSIGIMAIFAFGFIPPRKKSTTTTP